MQQGDARPQADIIDGGNDRTPPTATAVVTPSVMPCGPGVLCPTVRVSPVVTPGAPMLSIGDGDHESSDRTQASSSGISSSYGSQATDTGMLGTNGHQFASKTVWKGGGQERIDVENPNPGQIHYQDNNSNKYLYDPSTDSFPGSPNSVNKLLSNPSSSGAIQKGLNKYLRGN